MSLGEGSEGRRSPIHFATTNVGKFSEVWASASEYGIDLRRLRLKPPEIQSDSLEEIARTSALHIIRGGSPQPVMVEDAGLFIDALKGFPGPYSAYTYAKLGMGGILKLLEGQRNRRAHFACVIAYAESERLRLFGGRVEGLIVDRPRGRRGFGFDPIFQPLNQPKTFAEMTTREKNAYSHRIQAFRKLARWDVAKRPPSGRLG